MLKDGSKEVTFEPSLLNNPKQAKVKLEKLQLEMKKMQDDMNKILKIIESKKAEN